MLELDHRRRFEAISAILDLSGFSPFCAEPDNSKKTGEFLNFFLQRVEDSLNLKNVTENIVQTKFLGDGLLVIWEVPTANSKRFGSRVVLALHNLYITYPADIGDAIDDLTVRSPPQKVKIAIVQGELNEFSTVNGLEYVGNSLNLASRLSRYFPNLGFLVSRSVGLEQELVDRYLMSLARTLKFRTGEPREQEEVRYSLSDVSSIDDEEVNAHLQCIEGEQLMLQISTNREISRNGHVGQNEERSGSRSLKIFIASSKDLTEDKNALELGLRRNESDIGAKLDIMRGETESSALAIDGSQAQLNSLIETCDYFVCLFDQSVGEYTEEEFEVALSSFGKVGKPIIHVFEKNSEIRSLELGKKHITLIEFRQRLKELKYYKGEYESLDGLLSNISKELKSFVKDK